MSVDCADQHGIPFVWVNDPDELFPALGTPLRRKALPSAPFTYFDGQHVPDAAQCQIVSGEPKAGDHAPELERARSSETGPPPHRVGDVDFDRREKRTWENRRDQCGIAARIAGRV